MATVEEFKLESCCKSGHNNECGEDECLEISKQKWSFTPKLIAGILVNIVGATIPIGWHMTVINAPQYVIKPFTNTSLFNHYGIELDVSDLDLVWAFVVSIFIIGGLLGAAFADKILERFGRKKSFQLCALSHVVGSIIFACAKIGTSVELLVIGRLVVGFGSGLATCAVPTYLAELCPVKLRTVVSAVLPVGSSSGSMLGHALALKTVLGTEGYWPMLLGLIGLPCFICLCASVVVPESPRYLLVTRKKEASAERALSELRGKPLSDISRCSELLMYKKERREIQEGEVAENWDLKKIWETLPHLRMPVFLCLLVHVASQLSGISAVFYYSTSVFDVAGLTDFQTDLANLGAAGFNICMATGGVWLVSKFTLRRLILVSIASTGISLLGLALSLIFYPSDHFVSSILGKTAGAVESDDSVASYLCVFFIILFVVSFGAGLGSVPFALPSDIIPDGPRTAVSSVGCALNWSTNFLIGMTFPLLETVIGESVFFIFAGLMCIIYMFLLIFLKPSYRLHAIE